MQSITITGGIGKDAELRNAGDSQVCSFNVGVTQGWGDKKQTNWYRCSFWGKRGQSLHPYLLKGVKVAVQGELEIGEYEGKTQFNIRVNEVDIMSKRGDNNQGAQGHANQDGFGWPGDGGAFDDGLDSDSVPF